jgi:hypothetical protein
MRTKASDDRLKAGELARAVALGNDELLAAEKP